MGKVVSISKLAKIIENYRKQGKRIGFCNGNYDLLHPGHVMHFESAKKLCDVLVVAVADDKSVRKQKGPGRPIFNEDLRAYMVSQLSSVDFAIFNRHNKQSNVSKIINLIKPKYYIRGPDYINSKSGSFLNEKRDAIKAGCLIRYTKDKKFASRDIIKSIKEGKVYTV